MTILAQPLNVDWVLRIILIGILFGVGFTIGAFAVNAIVASLKARRVTAPPKA